MAEVIRGNVNTSGSGRVTSLASQRRARGVTAEGVLKQGETPAQWAAQVGVPANEVISGAGGHEWTYAARGAPTAPPTSQTGTGTPVNIPGMPAGLSGPQQNAYEAVYGTLKQYGLEALAPVLLGYVQENFDPSTINYLIQQTPQWQQRFYGNVLREKSGMQALDPATYLDLENQYSNVLQQYGIPHGMFGRSDFANWIGGDVSPSELQSRTQLAAQAVYNADPYYSQALQQFGITPGHQIAYFLDNKRALPFLQNQAQAAQIGAAALRNHLQMNPQTALTLASMGVSQSQAQQGYQQIGETLGRYQQLAQIQHQNPYTQSEAEQADLFGNAAAARHQQQLGLNEQAMFHGSAGLGTNYLHPNYGIEPVTQGAY